MKNKHRQISIIILICLQIWSCTSPPDVEKKFEQSPSERQLARNKELRDLLLSSKEGWKMIYFPNIKQLGGYTHLFKFNADNQVQMASDFDEKTETGISEYAIESTVGTTLSFVTFSRIHLLANKGDKGTASGDSRFLYVGHKKDEILFETYKTGQEVQFIKATAKDWQDLHKGFAIEKKLPNLDYKKTIEVYEGDKIKLSGDFGLTPESRQISFRFYLNIWDNYGYAFTPDGFIISPALRIGDKEISTFIFNKKDNIFIGEGTNGLKAILKFTKYKR